MARLGDEALADLKTAVRTNRSNSATTAPWGAWD